MRQPSQALDFKRSRVGKSRREPFGRAIRTLDQNLIEEFRRRKIR